MVESIAKNNVMANTRNKNNRFGKKINLMFLELCRRSTFKDGRLSPVSSKKHFEHSYNCNFGSISERVFSAIDVNAN